MCISVAGGLIKHTIDKAWFYVPLGHISHYVVHYVKDLDAPLNVKTFAPTKIFEERHIPKLLPVASKCIATKCTKAADERLALAGRTVCAREDGVGGWPECCWVELHSTGALLGSRRRIAN